MKIGRQEHRSSSISTSNADTIVVRGKDLCAELLGKVSFTDYFWFLLTGAMPDARQRQVLDSTLVAIAEHGLVPSVQASRMTYAAAPEALQGAVAAGILGCGSVILGAAENAGRMLADIVARSAQQSLKDAAAAVVGELRAAKKPIPGYGHPLHKGEDPRASKLFAVATAAGVPDPHRAAAKMVESVLPEITGKTLVMNVSAAIPAVLLDAGFPVGALKGVPILARTASLIGHLLEEQAKPIGFVLSHAASQAISYDGQVPSGFVAGDAFKGLDVLKGVRIVEQGTFITGPCCGMMLADLGADVIKLESPDGDPYRAYQGGSYSPHFQAYNRNKRSLALDMKQGGDRAVFDTLIREADVFIQNFRPGTADRLGAGAKRLQELNPKLVYCSISGFGADGPYVDRPSYDSVAQALSGFLSVVVDEDRPRFLGPALADAITGIYASYGVLGALFDRSRTGKGRMVEVSMLEAMAHFAVEPFAAYFALGTVPKSADRPRLAQAHILRTKDGGLIAIHLSSLEKFWTGLLAAIEAPELGADPRFNTRLLRIENYDALGRELDRRFSEHSVAEWVEKLGSADVPFAPINKVSAVVEDPQVKHLGLMVPVENPHAAKQSVRPPVQFDGQRAAAVRPAPLLNEHGADIRAALAGAKGWPELRA